MSDFNYLDIMTAPSSQSSYGTSPSSSAASSNNRFKKITNNSNMKSELGHFKNKLMDLLSKEFEQPLGRELEYIKRKRGESEYLDDVKRVRDSIIRMRESAEDTLLDMRRYLDYVEVEKDKEGESRLYLPGLEEKKKLDEIKMPDILGFTKDPVKAERYLPFVMEMTRTFLGFEGFSLHNALVKLKGALESGEKELSTSEKIDMGFCTTFKQLDFKPLYEIENYYNLFRMLENGRFNINKFLDRKSEKGNFSDRDRDRDDRNRDRDRDRDRDRKKKKKKRDLFGGESDFLKALKSSIKKGKHKNGTTKGDTGKLRIVESDSKTPKKIREYIEYMLKKEKAEGKITGVSYEDIKVEEVLQLLKRTGKNILKNKIGKNEEETTKFTDMYDVITRYKTISDEDKYSSQRRKLKEFLNPSVADYKKENIIEDVKRLFATGNAKKLWEMVENSKDSTEFVIVDFYTGKHIHFTKAKLNNDYELAHTMINAYGIFYDKYDFGNLPLSSDSKLGRYRASIKILNGVLLYTKILREMLIKIDQRLYVDLPKNVIEKPKFENRNNRANNKRVLEFRQLLREINREINQANNEEKRKKLFAIKEKIMANNPIFQ